MYAYFAIWFRRVCINQKNFQSLYFTVNRVLMKLFKTSNIQIISECRNFFGIELPRVQLVKRFDKFCISRVTKLSSVHFLSNLVDRPGICVSV